MPGVGLTPPTWSQPPSPRKPRIAPSRGVSSTIVKRPLKAFLNIA